MHHLTIASPYLQILSALAGLVVGSIIVFAAPRLVSDRVSDPVAYAPAVVLLPLVGVWLARWRQVYALGLEVLTALVFEALSVRYGADSRLVLSALYSTVLIAIAYIDLDVRLVLNKLSFPGVALALAGSLWWPDFGLLNSVKGLLAGLLIFVVFQVIGRGALGTGDTKLALLVGAMRGFPGVLNALLLGVILGGLGAIFALIVLRRGRRDYIAYAPYLSAGAILSFFVTSP